MSQSGDARMPLCILLAHEWRLSWRGLVDFVTRRGNKAATGSSFKLILLVAGLALLAHAIAFGLTSTSAPLMAGDAASIIKLTATLAFTFLLMTSAGLDSAAFTLYSRSDYELLFSSPVPPRTVFIIRAFNIFIFTGAKVFLYGAPFLNILAWRDGPHWLIGYVILAAMTALATLLAVAVAMGLVATIGVKRTRLISQLLAAFVGLGVFVLLQRDLLFSETARAQFEAWMLTLDRSTLQSIPFWPALALLGDGLKGAGFLVGAFCMAAAGLYTLAMPFYRASIAVSGLAEPLARRRASKPVRFGGTILRALISKERKLVLRDPWLLSQILTQSLFLVPICAVVLKQYWSGSGDASLFVPMFVILAGQIAGGLTWIALSADDAPDLIGTAPQMPGLMRNAKLLTIGYLTVLFVTGPLILLLIVAPNAGLPALLGVLIGAAATIKINLWHQPRPGAAERRQRKSSNSTLINLAEMIVLMLIAGAIWLVMQHFLSAALLAAALAGIAMVMLRIMRRPLVV
jgi:ABC-2 type transport system permease protein